MVEYAHSLRSIGQALELLAVEDFEMRMEQENILVTCRLPRPKAPSAGEAQQADLLQHVWGVLPKDSSLELNLLVAHPSETIKMDLRYSPSDVERLDGEGKAKRVHAAEPAAPGLSQFLRTVGTYVSRKPARLLRISRRAESLSVAYEMSSGQEKEEVFSWSNLYDMWVRMAMGRRDRDGVKL